MLKKDFFVLGLIIGVLLPAIMYVILYYGGELLVNLNITRKTPDMDDIMLISVFANLLPLRYYFVTLKYDQTGRGVLLITFVLGILYFIMKTG